MKNQIKKSAWRWIPETYRCIQVLLLREEWLVNDKHFDGRKIGAQNYLTPSVAMHLPSPRSSIIASNWQR